MARYCPARGDVVWLQFDPQAGQEQSGRRPALVLSPEAYNSRTGLMLCVPITSRIKGYPFEVLIPEGLKTGGAILSDQVKSVDWAARKATRLERISDECLQTVLAKIRVLLD